jgi:ATP-dependent Clp protease ATP-binding subunit ClpC
MTSNLGSELIGRRRLGFEGGEDNGDMQERIMGRLREAFRPEFLNRIDEIIIFRQLDETQLRQITRLLLEETSRRLHAQAVTVQFTDEAVDWLAARGYQPEFGARPLRRTIQREVDNRLSSMLLDGRLLPGQHVTVETEGDALEFRVSEHDTAQVPAQPAGPDQAAAARQS